LYIQDPEFSSIFSNCQIKAQGGYYVNQGYLFKEEKLCIHLSSHRKLLVKERREGGLMGYFGGRKDIEHVKREIFLASHEMRCPEVLFMLETVLAEIQEGGELDFKTF